MGDPRSSQNAVTLAGQDARRWSVVNLVFWTFLLLYSWWVFSLPLFPSQDGPMHLYYVHVISRLLAGDPSFAHYFSIRTPLPPYAIHYLLLLGFGKFVTPLVAE